MQDIPGPVDENGWSDDEFDGYVNDEAEEMQTAIEGEREHETDCGVGMVEVDISQSTGGESDVPEYTLTPGCTHPVYRK